MGGPLPLGRIQSIFADVRVSKSCVRFVSFSYQKIAKNGLANGCPL